MIKIERGTCPPKLNSARRKLRANDYKDDMVKDALKTMQHGKCCYCEKDLSQVGRSAIWVDHFIAKTHNSFKDGEGLTNWNLANAWGNLLMACSTCNRDKGTDEPFDSTTNERKLIDPCDSAIDPEDHIEFMIEGVVIFYKSKLESQLGENTLRNLKLKSRRDIYSILRKRKLEIDKIFSDIVDGLIESNAAHVLSKQNDLRKMSSAHQPHSAFCRCYIRQVLQKFNTENLIIINEFHNIHLVPIVINIASGFQTIV